MGVGLIAVLGAACKRWKALQMYTQTRLTHNREVSNFDTHLAKGLPGRFYAPKNVFFYFYHGCQTPHGKLSYH